MKDESLLLDYRALALKSVTTGKYLSEIITTHGIYYSKTSPVELLNKACLRHHSSKEGRQEAARKLLNFHQKPPFLISEDIAVFPTKSSIHPDCIWIFSHFFKTEAIEKEKTKITFHNETVIEVPISLYTVKQQKFRMHTLLSHAQQSKRAYIASHPLFGMAPDLAMQQLK
ncbi:competence protein ComK [Sporosarcina koreensis]|uniref:competence protein ComK n=1 Tax=Bacillales TaxID=1385 RepID=UPI00075A094A|nr:competence protein ComK [Sporosarcina koreensis]